MKIHVFNLTQSGFNSPQRKKATKKRELKHINGFESKVKVQLFPLKRWKDVWKRLLVTRLFPVWGRGRGRWSAR